LGRPDVAAIRWFFRCLAIRCDVLPSAIINSLSPTKNLRGNWYATPSSSFFRGFGDLRLRWKSIIRKLPPESSLASASSGGMPQGVFSTCGVSIFLPRGVRCFLLLHSRDRSGTANGLSYTLNPKRTARKKCFTKWFRTSRQLLSSKLRKWVSGRAPEAVVHDSGDEDSRRNTSSKGVEGKPSIGRTICWRDLSGPDKRVHLNWLLRLLD